MLVMWKMCILKTKYTVRQVKKRKYFFKAKENREEKKLAVYESFRTSVGGNCRTDKIYEARGKCLSDRNTFAEWIKLDQYGDGEL